MEKAFDLVMRVSRVFGLAPYARGTMYQLSRHLDVIGKIAITIICVSNASVIIYSVITYEHPFATLDYFQHTAKLSVLFLAIFGIFTASGRMKRMVHYMEELNQINVTLPHRRKVSNRMYQVLLVFVIGVTVERLADLINYCIQMNSHMYDNFRVVMMAFRFFKVIEYTIVTLLSTQIIIFATNIQMTLKMINENLENLIPDTHSEKRTKIGTTIPKAAWKDTRTVIINTSNDTTNTYEVSERNISHIIRQLAISYSKICEIIRTTTNFDGFLIIVILLFHTIHVEFNWHKNILWILSSESDKYFLIVPSIRSFMHSMALLMCVESFHQTHVQIDKTFFLINILKSRWDNEAVRNELDLFLSLFLLNKPMYSPLDICTLDRALVVKIFGFLVTYMVIIMTYGPEKKDSLLFSANKQLYL